MKTLLMQSCDSFLRGKLKKIKADFVAGDKEGRQVDGTVRQNVL